MGRCIYCGQPARLFRNQHNACKEQHDHALARIPDFLPKFLKSDLPPDRFCQLLQEGARASFITKSELSNAISRGILDAIASACGERILNAEELERFSNVADALTPLLSGNKEAEEKLLKVDVLMQLSEKRVPDVVKIEGDMPIDLRGGERVVWIFNNVALYRDQVDEVAPEQLPGVLISLDRSDYVRPSALMRMNCDKLRKEARGDLVTTNQSLFFVQAADQMTRLSFARISSLRAFSDHLEIISSAGKRRVFTVEDAWFAANLWAGLIRLIRS
jgi:hypothetical protein